MRCACVNGTFTSDSRVARFTRIPWKSATVPSSARGSIPRAGGRAGPRTHLHLTNAAAVAFYEHLFDGPRASDESIAARLSPEVVRGVWPLWESRLDSERLARVRRLVGG